MRRSAKTISQILDFFNNPGPRWPLSQKNSSYNNTLNPESDSLEGAAPHDLYFQQPIPLVFGFDRALLDIGLGNMSTPPRNFASWLEQHPSAAGGGRPRRLSRIPQVFKSGDIQTVFQPIVNLDGGEIFAYEALVRSTAPQYESPPALFAAALGAAVCGALGRAIREQATEHCSGHRLFLNIHPNEFDEGWLVQPTDPIFQHNHAIYLEITESVPLSHFDYCHSVLKEVRGKGVHVAVDDLGAGYSNLRYIADLEPEIVKLDRGLVSDLHRDPRRKKLVKNIVQLCTGMGARVVAEGIETPDEAMAIRDTGAHYGQGYLFARPAFPLPKADVAILK